jgi:hypothetical protein
MIKEAIEKILDLADPRFEDRFGVRYCTQKLYPINPPMAPYLEVASLTGVVDYFRAQPDGELAKGAYIVIHDTTEVVVFSPITTPDKVREKLVEASFDPPGVDLRNWTPIEEFLLALQSTFVTTENRDKLLTLLGSVKDVSEADYTDNGVTQRVVRKNGLHIGSEAAVHSSVILAPYRTFPEIEQPESPFILRLRKNRHTDGVDAMLSLADGGAWTIVARARIKEFLNTHLPETWVLA